MTEKTKNAEFDKLVNKVIALGDEISYAKSAAELLNFRAKEYDFEALPITKMLLNHIKAAEKILES